ncbi:MAG: hypothetical protein KJ607_06145 [Bacteroidetes bacterium]|nr:hypothetical protein [Bacteroidota bacterium]
MHRPAENSKGFTYEDWLRYERKKARARAAYHSRMRFSEFKKTKIYKTSRVIYALFDIIYFAMGIAILVVPVVYTLLKGIDTRYIGRTIATLIATQIVGTIFIIMIGLSRCEFLRNIFFRKGFTGPK